MFTLQVHFTVFLLDFLFALNFKVNVHCAPGKKKKKKVSLKPRGLQIKIIVISRVNPLNGASVRLPDGIICKYDS